MDFNTILKDLSQFRGNRTALVAANGDTVLWKELEQLVQCAAESWIPLLPGEGVGVLVPVSVELAITLLSLFYSGHPAVLADPAGGLGPLVASWKSAKLKYLVTLPLLLWVKPFIPALWAFKLRSPSSLLRSRAPKQDLRVETLSDSQTAPTPSTPALLTYTTGTTGRPKAIARTLPFLMGQQKNLGPRIGPKGRTCCDACPSRLYSFLSGSGLHHCFTPHPRRSLGKSALLTSFEANGSGKSRDDSRKPLFY